MHARFQRTILNTIRRVHQLILAPGSECRNFRKANRFADRLLHQQQLLLLLQHLLVLKSFMKIISSQTIYYNTYYYSIRSAKTPAPYSRSELMRICVAKVVRGLHFIHRVETTM